MRWLLFYYLAFAILAPAARCDTRFIRPPRYDSNIDQDPSNNIRYEAGTSIAITWETDLDEITLGFVQQLGGDMIGTVYLAENTTDNRYTWKAQHDPYDYTTHQEDAIGWFTLYKPGDTDALRGSQRFNVTAPKSDSTTTAAVSTTALSLTTETSISQSTATGSSSSQETSANSDPESNSGLSPAATTGVAVAASLGSVLALAGIGLLAWKHFRRRARDSNVPSEPEEPRQPIMSILGYNKSELGGRPMNELPGHPVIYPEFAKSQPGVHEAP
ncbi:hypothetical protein B0T10DRAFT_576976 [Thelonectria olida]|uniref:Uncharacterized protein n=1 Tax=Thelonectria olida TaxID=1576542 RepID=A0A9P9AJB5_9HYPO|nr:hypothetical protein B0T10DRAFT_576976 [Thelonectria olida]